MAAVQRVGRARVVLFVAVVFLRQSRYVWCMYTTALEVRALVRGVHPDET